MSLCNSPTGLLSTRSATQCQTTLPSPQTRKKRASPTSPWPSALVCARDTSAWQATGKRADTALTLHCTTQNGCTRRETAQPARPMRTDAKSEPRRSSSRITTPAPVKRRTAPGPPTEHRAELKTTKPPPPLRAPGTHPPQRKKVRQTTPRVSRAACCPLSPLLRPVVWGEGHSATRPCTRENTAQYNTSRGRECPQTQTKSQAGVSRIRTASCFTVSCSHASALTTLTHLHGSAHSREEKRAVRSAHSALRGCVRMQAGFAAFALFLALCAHTTGYCLLACLFVCLFAVSVRACQSRWLLAALLSRALRRLGRGRERQPSPDGARKHVFRNCCVGTIRVWATRARTATTTTAREGITAYGAVCSTFLFSGIYF